MKYDVALLFRVALAMLGIKMLADVVRAYLMGRREVTRGKSVHLQRHRKVILVTYGVFFAAVVAGTFTFGDSWIASAAFIVAGVSAIVGAIALAWLIIRERWH